MFVGGLSYASSIDFMIFVHDPFFYLHGFFYHSSLSSSSSTVASFLGFSAFSFAFYFVYRRNMFSFSFAKDKRATHVVMVSTEYLLANKKRVNCTDSL